ncbi:MAG: 23S rRNA (adenine(2503)-C(2))-methyltransferase RlmN [bacterium]
MDFLKLQTILTERKEPAFRQKQVRNALFVELIEDWDKATTLSKELREVLKQVVPISSLEILSQHRSKRGDTRKVTFLLDDGLIIESVLMEHFGDRNTVCVSSQAGCPMACAFCATGKLGFKRNLRVDEIVDQVMHFARQLRTEDRRVSNVVVMGMGEPFHNYDNVLAALRILNHKDGLNIGARKITISTCGIVPGIERLANEPEQFNLAISLHAPIDSIRSKIMPVNLAYPLNKLMRALRDYIKKTNRKVFVEYVMLKGVNDSLDLADDLADLLGKDLFQVNLIKYHQTGSFAPTEVLERNAFKERLEEHGIITTHRVTFGEDILAACGQLAGKEVPKNLEPQNSEGQWLMENDK